MLDWRGILGLAVGGLLIVVGINPPYFSLALEEQSLLPFIALLAGISLLVISLWICRLSIRAAHIVNTTVPILCQLSVNEKDESRTHKAVLKAEVQSWEMELERASRFVGVSNTKARLWLDPQSGEPIIVRAEGHMMPVVPKLSFAATQTVI